MPQSRRQKKRARHAAKRKAKRKATHTRTASTSKRSLLMRALKWPVMGCWVNAEWEDPTQLNQVVVARRDPATGEVYIGMYLVDRACLGIKDAHAASFLSASEFRRELLTQIAQTQDIIQIEFDLAAAIVKVGLDYAADLGFRPHRDYRDASILLRDAHPENVKEEIPVGGENGQPFFIAGPYDNVQHILRHLERNPGPGKYHFTAPIGPDMDLPISAETWETLNIVDAETEEYIDVDSRVILEDGEMQIHPPDDASFSVFRTDPEDE
jgi:hypothetical protein